MADIVPLAKGLLEKYCQKMKRPAARFTPEAETALAQHTWPGNVRELDNVIQRALILQTGHFITPADLHMLSGAISMTTNQSSSMPVVEESPLVEEDSGKLGSDLRQHEFQLIIDALKATGGSRKEAAERLAISPRTLRYKLAKIRESGIDLDALL